MKKIWLIVLACFFSCTTQCVMFHIIGSFVSGISAANAWGDIVYPANRTNKHSFVKNNAGKEDLVYKGYLWTKAITLSGLSFYLGRQFFKNFK